jgi:hypothetical protein
MLEILNTLFQSVQAQFSGLIAARYFTNYTDIIAGLMLQNNVLFARHNRRSKILASVRGF